MTDSKQERDKISALILETHESISDLQKTLESGKLVAVLAIDIRGEL